MSIYKATASLFEFALDKMLEEAAQGKPFTVKRDCLIKVFNDTISDNERMNKQLRNMQPRQLVELLREDAAAKRAEIESRPFLVDLIAEDEAELLDKAEQRHNSQ